MSKTEVLPHDEAFKVTATILQGSNLGVRFSIEPGYYLYKDSIAINPHGMTSIGKISIPDGIKKNDEFFGDVEVFYKALDISTEIYSNSDSYEVEVTYQGCAEVGFCYPPLSQRFDFPTSVRRRID